MLTPVFEFEWERPAKGKDGFAWGEAASGDRLLVPIDGAVFEPYRPLEECTGLFRTFAFIEPTPSAVLAFANRYGRLDDNPQLDFALWTEHVRRMRVLVSVWDAITAQDWKSLRPILGKEPRLFTAGNDADSARPEELVNAAVQLLYQEVGGRTFGWTFGAWARQKSPPVIWLPTAKRLVLKIVPPSLREGMYLQLAHAILGDKHFQQCQACGRWFELAPGKNRADRQTCSDSCRVRLYRDRQERARTLHAEGKSVKSIAKELGTEVETVKGWINKQKG